MKLFALLAVFCAAGRLANAQMSMSDSMLQQLSSPRLTEDKQRALFNMGGETPLKLTINSITANTSSVNNAAARQLKGDKVAFPILATLPNGGSAVYITTLKPCGVIMPHVHPRATEQYLVVSGTMATGLAEEASGMQNVTATLTAGQSFVAPQGLLHYNANRQCTPLVFVQIFNNADPGTVNIINALAALKNVDGQTNSAIGASSLMASSLGAFILDSSCLQSCGLPMNGMSDLSSNLSPEMQAFVGLSSSPMMAPAMAASG